MSNRILFQEHSKRRMAENSQGTLPRSLLRSALKRREGGQLRAEKEAARNLAVGANQRHVLRVYPDVVENPVPKCFSSSSFFFFFFFHFPYEMLPLKQ